MVDYIGLKFGPRMLSAGVLWGGHLHPARIGIAHMIQFTPGFEYWLGVDGKEAISSASFGRINPAGSEFDRKISVNPNQTWTLRVRNLFNHSATFEVRIYVSNLSRFNQRPHQSLQP